jgi:hypothetical protein
MNGMNGRRVDKTFSADTVKASLDGAFVYQLGHGPLKAERRVRFPYALPRLQAPPSSGITYGMTSAKLVSVKLPLKIFQAIPGAHEGRSQFIIAALEEKISREQTKWKPSTERGERLAKLLEKGASERGAPLDKEGIARELRERRGNLH